MPPNASIEVMVMLLLALTSSTTAAFNITRILNEFPDLSTFNGLLTQTKLADKINRRQTITVLVVSNGAMGVVTSLPADVQRKVLSVHVVLDYYDADKLGAMKNRSAVLTTLFQSTGQATDRMGFINYTRRTGVDGAMMFGSAEPGAPLTSQMVKSVVSHPYNISVLEITSAIVPPGVAGSDGDGSNAHAPPPTHNKAPAPAPATAPSKRKKAQALTPAPANGSTVDAPADSPGPSLDANGPVADSPYGPVADSPDADGPTADNDDGSATRRGVTSAGLGVMALLATLALL